MKTVAHQPTDTKSNEGERDTYREWNTVACLTSFASHTDKIAASVARASMAVSRAEGALRSGDEPPRHSLQLAALDLKGALIEATFLRDLIGDVAEGFLGSDDDEGARGNHHVLARLGVLVARLEPARTKEAASKAPENEEAGDAEDEPEAPTEVPLKLSTTLYEILEAANESEHPDERPQESDLGVYGWVDEIARTTLEAAYTLGASRRPEDQARAREYLLIHQYIIRRMLALLEKGAPNG